jgi:hypothetical protein
MREGVDLLNSYEAVMQEYTYIDHSGGPAIAANGSRSPEALVKQS